MKFRKTTAKTVVQDLHATAAWLELSGNLDDKKHIAKFLNHCLDTFHTEGVFGTEGQCDPRGDHR
jgi:hypothetical protein